MNEEIKEAWKTELRSGKYPQGDGYLRQWNIDTQQWEYCCLGVLCEMSGLGEWEEFITQAGDRKAYSYLDSDQYLPNEVAQWAGIDSDYEEGTVQAQLAEMNDINKSFNQITDNLDAVLNGTYEEEEEEDD
jgi:hypothetical protein